MNICEKCTHHFLDPRFWILTSEPRWQQSTASPSCLTIPPPEEVGVSDMTDDGLDRLRVKDPFMYYSYRGCTGATNAQEA